MAVEEIPMFVPKIPAFLNIFEPILLNNAVQNSFMEEYLPLSGQSGRLAGGTLSFHITGTNYGIKFSDSYLFIKGRLIGTRPQRAQAGNVAALDALEVDDALLSVGVINNLAHSLFESIQVNLNNKSISFSEKHYAYKAYLDTLLNYTKDIQDSYYRTEGWLKDNPNNMEDINTLVGGTGPIAQRRNLFFFNRRTGGFRILINTPLFRMEKALIPHVDVDITLTRHANPNFYIMHDETERGVFDFEITGAKLCVQKIECIPEYRIGVENIMSIEERPVDYILTDPQISTFHVPQGSTNFDESNLFHGFLPQRVLIFMTDTDAFNGRGSRNPFNFKHNDVRDICLYKDGVAYPKPAQVMNFTNKDYIEAYTVFMNSLSSGPCNYFAPNITPQEWGSGFTIFSYDMSPDQEGGTDPHSIINKPCNVRLSIRFGRGLAEATTIFVYHEQKLKVTIDSSRAVLVEATP